MDERTHSSLGHAFPDSTTRNGICQRKKAVSATLRPCVRGPRLPPVRSWAMLKIKEVSISPVMLSSLPRTQLHRTGPPKTCKRHQASDSCWPKREALAGSGEVRNAQKWYSQGTGIFSDCIRPEETKNQMLQVKGICPCSEQRHIKGDISDMSK